MFSPTNEKTPYEQLLQSGEKETNQASKITIHDREV